MLSGEASGAGFWKVARPHDEKAQTRLCWREVAEGPTERTSEWGDRMAMMKVDLAGAFSSICHNENFEIPVR